MNKIIFTILSLSFILADINFSGDARIRPRLDMKNNGDNTSSTELYSLYRARLNISSTIGDGWFFETKLGIDDIANMRRMGGVDDLGQLLSSPNVSFLNLYYGIKGDNCGLWGGIIPLEHNPALDIHFYPDKIVDIPWILWNSSSTTGFAGYLYKFNWFVSIDKDTKEIDVDGNGAIDSYTLGFDFDMEWNKYLDIHPRILVSIGDEIESWPMTFGMDTKFEQLFGFNSMLSYSYSTEMNNENNKYNIDHLRFKIDRDLGPGKFTFWVDKATHVDHEEIQTKLMYIWFDYDYNLFNSELGSVSIKPTIRYQTGKVGDGVTSMQDSDYNRMKLEITTEIKFK